MLRVNVLSRSVLRVNLLRRSVGSVHSPNELDLRVGRIREIALHENADTLYVSQVEIDDNGGSVQVCSGLRGIVPANVLEGRRVVLVRNLKPSKMRGVKSEAMLLCAARTDIETSKLIVEPVKPADQCNLGERVMFSTAEPVDVPKRLKSAVWTEIADRLRVNAEGKVVFNEEGDVHVLDKCTVPTEFAGSEVR